MGEWPEFVAPQVGRFQGVVLILGSKGSALTVSHTKGERTQNESEQAKNQTSKTPTTSAEHIALVNMGRIGAAVRDG